MDNGLAAATQYIEISAGRLRAGLWAMTALRHLTQGFFHLLIHLRDEKGGMQVSEEQGESARRITEPGPEKLPAVCAERCLHDSTYHALKRVSCEYHGGVLLLFGCLPSYYLKQVAQSLVAAIPGVGRVENHIAVEALNGHAEGEP